MKKFSVLILICTMMFLLAGCNLFSKPGSITGTVTDSITGEPIEEVSVVVKGSSAKTNAQGVYTIEEVKQGKFQLKAVKDGYVNYTHDVSIIAEEQTTHDFIMVPTQYANLTGSVVDKETKEPIAGVAINIGGKSGLTDAEGKFSLVAVPTGEQEFTATKTKYIPYTSTINVEYDKANNIDFEMELDYVGLVTGYVTDGRGGPGVAGAKLTALDKYTTTTDANGYFELYVKADVVFDIMVQKEHRAEVRVQDVTIGYEDQMYLEIPSRPVFDPAAPVSAPVITLTNLEAGQEISGKHTVGISINGENPIYLYYVYLGGEQRFPREGFAQNTSEATIELNTTLHPNGPSYLRVLTYDHNENAAMIIVPVVINNDPVAEVVPGRVHVMNIISTSYGRNLRFYKDNNMNLLSLPNGDTFDLNTIPDEAVMNNSVIWSAATGATGYTVYRSFDGENYRKLGNVTSARYDDFSPELEANKKTYYKVVPYNSFGEGEAVIHSTTLLPGFNVVLVSPADTAVNVPLQPTFKWEIQSLQEFDMDIAEFEYTLRVYDATSWKIVDESIYDETEFKSPVTLKPGNVYTWDIFDAEAFALYRYDATGYSYALSVANEYTEEGSINGEFVFTTIAE